MRRTEQAQGLRLTKFEEVYGRTVRRELSQAEAAEVLGMSQRTFRRWRDRFEADGAEGLYDHCLGRASARRAPVDEDNRTQVGRALRHLGIELIAAYSPEARGRSERMFGTLQKRLPQELRLAGVTEMAEANRFLREVYLPSHNARFATPAEADGSAFVPFAGAIDDILCVHADRVVGNDNTVRYRGLSLQIPPDPHRHHYVKARVRVHEYPDGTLAIFHGPRCLARYQATGELVEPQCRQAA